MHIIYYTSLYAIKYKVCEVYGVSSDITFQSSLFIRGSENCLCPKL